MHSTQPRIIFISLKIEKLHYYSYLHIYLYTQNLEDLSSSTQPAPTGKNKRLDP